ncbi:hypothetical protein [Mameliella alba]|uniref:Uncharacterized protein n=1 Tax=Mameliella alba TaxID=561184 RepID=A0A0B3S191_9RHOB|nr:hypothetical protein [Mameliella alba]KHQ50386.1 hypothetical protein OA50_05061 [Mameliella alba]
MLNLNLKPEPYWIDLPRGVQVQVLPAGSTIVEQVRLDMRQGADPDADSEDAAPQPAGMVPFAKGVARAVIVAWEGVGDENGNPIEPSPDYIDAMLEDGAIYRAFMDKYVLPALAVDEEGNG